MVPRLALTVGLRAGDITNRIIAANPGVLDKRPKGTRDVAAPRGIHVTIAG